MMNTLVLIFGACIGSFLNVCIFRIPGNLSIMAPGSHCPVCKNPIPFYCNIPVLSYLFLRGRCKNCKTAISTRYPLVEILTAGLTLCLFMRFGLTPALGFWLAFGYTLIVISFIDMDHQIIPDRISLPGIVLFASSPFFIPEMSLGKVLGGILCGGGILYAIAWVYFTLRKKEGMGGGDIKLLAMIGAATGVQGVLFTIFAGSLLGTFAGILSMVAGKAWNQGLKIPFGPFLSLGAILYLFYGQALIHWYLVTLTGY